MVFWSGTSCQCASETNIHHNKAINTCCRGYTTRVANRRLFGSICSVCESGRRGKEGEREMDSPSWMREDWWFETTVTICCSRGGASRLAFSCWPCLTFNPLTLSCRCVKRPDINWSTFKRSNLLTSCPSFQDCCQGKLLNYISKPHTIRYLHFISSFLNDSGDSLLFQKEKLFVTLKEFQSHDWSKWRLVEKRLSYK